MKHYRGAVFFDVDGTLIDMRRGICQIPAKALAAIQTLQKTGFLTCLASGRSKGTLPKFTNLLDGAISCNGAAAEIEGTLLFEHYIAADIVKDFLHYIQENKQGCILESTKGYWYTQAGNTAYLRYLEQEIPKMQQLTTCNPLSQEEVRAFTRPIAKLQVFCDNEDVYQTIKAAFAGKLIFAAHRDKWAADIAPCGISKGSGILEVAKHLSIPLENTYAFGDDHNDVEMLQTVAHGIAMTPHAHTLDAVAEYVTDSVGENGIVKGLTHFGLL